jgi:ubiquinone biosynthesis protein
MKKKYWVSPLVEDFERSPIEIKPVKKPSPLRFVTVYFLLFRTLARNFLLNIRVQDESKRETAKGRNVRLALESLGGLYVKAGQLIAMRTDMNHPDFCSELSKLQDRSYGFDPAISRQYIEEHLGFPVWGAFSEFVDQPIAAASLAQVHKAKLQNENKWVAVKVQKPYTEEYLKGDIRMIKQILRLYSFFKDADYLAVDEMIWELNQMLMEEVDFRFEQVNLKKFRKLLKKHGIYVPKVYKQYCTKKVVVMEYIHGITMAEYIKVKRNDPQRLNSWLRRNKINPKKVGGNLIKSVLRQLFEENIFHGDLHPGNIMLLKNNKVALIDLGSVGSSDAYFLDLYRMQIDAVAKKEYLKAAEYILLMSPQLKPVDPKRLIRDLAKAIRSGEAKSSLTGLTKDERAKVFSDTQEEINQTIGKYKLRPDWSFLKFNRSLTTLEYTLYYLDPKMNFNSAFESYNKQAEKRRRMTAKTSLTLVSEAIKNYGPLVLSNLRRKSLPFLGPLNGFLRFISGPLKYMKYLLWAGLICMVFCFLNQHYNEAISWMYEPEGSLDNLFRQAPRFSELVWLIFIVIGFFGIRAYGKFVRNILTPLKPSYG